MKLCNNARNCCYGHCFLGNVCGYDENLKQEDECPQHAEDLDFFNACPDAIYMGTSFLNPSCEEGENEDDNNGISGISLCDTPA